MIAIRPVSFSFATPFRNLFFTSVKNKKDKLFPGKLYSLSKLQNVLGKKYKMSMQESLSIVQGLYEKGYLTYPRTNSEYLATAEKDKIRQILASCQKIGYPVKFKDGKTIFDDSKIESHSALTPTYKIPDVSKLSEKETEQERLMEEWENLSMELEEL